MYTPTERAMYFLRLIDLEPGFHIEKEIFPQTAVLVSVYYYGGGSGLYCVNSLFDLPGNNLIGRTEMLKAAICATRIRAQIENKDLELFPYVEVSKTGFIRKVLEQWFGHGQQSIDLIDQEILASIAISIYAKKQSGALFFIKELMPLDASEIIKRTAPIIGEEFSKRVCL